MDYFRGFAPVVEWKEMTPILDFLIAISWFQLFLPTFMAVFIDYKIVSAIDHKYWRIDFAKILDLWFFNDGSVDKIIIKAFGE